MTCELVPDAGRDGENATKCVTCPRDGETRIVAVPNYAVNGGQLDQPSPYVIETVVLCDHCAVLREDVL